MRVQGNYPLKTDSMFWVKAMRPVLSKRYYVYALAGDGTGVRRLGQFRTKWGANRYKRKVRKELG